MGTPAYMPPEHAMGESDTLDERADVFGLGAILCEILTGDPTYTGEDGHQVLRKAIRGDLEDCQRRLDQSGASQDLVDLTRDCLARECTKRPRNAEAVSRRVTHHLESVAKQLKQAEIRRKLSYFVAAALVLLVANQRASLAFLAREQSVLVFLLGSILLSVSTGLPCDATHSAKALVRLP